MKRWTRTTLTEQRQKRINLTLRMAELQRATEVMAQARRVQLGLSLTRKPH